MNPEERIQLEKDALNAAVDRLLEQIVARHLPPEQWKYVFQALEETHQRYKSALEEGAQSVKREEVAELYLQQAAEIDGYVKTITQAAVGYHNRRTEG